MEYLNYLFCEYQNKIEKSKVSRMSIWYNGNELKK